MFSLIFLGTFLVIFQCKQLTFLLDLLSIQSLMRLYIWYFKYFILFFDKNKIDFYIDLLSNNLAKFTYKFYYIADAFAHSKYKIPLAQNSSWRSEHVVPLLSALHLLMSGRFVIRFLISWSDTSYHPG